MSVGDYSLEPFRAARVPATLLVLGTASALLYSHSGDPHRFTQGISAYIATYIAQFALYLGACYAVLRWRKDAAGRRVTATFVFTLVLVFAFAGVFRAQLVEEKDYLSNDVYRYVWDGRVQAAGINPYRYVPSDDSLKSLRDDRIYPNINRRDFAQTIYPPAAQAIFLATYLVAPSSTTAFKLGMSLFDVVTMLAIALALVRMGGNPAQVIVFAWHPLIIWEGAHSGHIESAAMAFIALALLAWSREKFALSGVALALATLVKLYPVLLLPVFAGRIIKERQDEREDAQGQIANRRAPRAIGGRMSIPMVIAFVATVVAAYIPYMSVGTGVIGYLPGYLQEEGFVQSGSRYFLLGLTRLAIPMPTAVYLGIAALAIVGLSVSLFLRDKRNAVDLSRASAGLIGLFLVLSTPRYSWYIAWIIPFLCFVPAISWLYLTGASVLLYVLWLTPDYPNIPLWLGAAVYAPTLALLGIERVRARRSATVINE